MDTGAKPLAGRRGETITEGLDGLRERLKEYRAIGARFAKWRAVIRINGPIAEPDVYQRECECAGPLRCPVPGTGHRSNSRTGSAHGGNSHYRALQRSDGRACSIPCSMPCTNTRCCSKACCSSQTWCYQAAYALCRHRSWKLQTRRFRACWRHVPAASSRCRLLVWRPKRLSGDKTSECDQSNLGAKPWKISFSYGRALQDQALATWLGDEKTIGQLNRPTITGQNATPPRLLASTTQPWIAGLPGRSRRPRSGFRG